MEFHLWEAYSSKKISVDLSKELREKIRLKIDNIIKFSNNIGITAARIYDYFIYQKTPIPLNILIKVSIELGVDILKIEKNILSYKSKFAPIKNSINNPVLPIQIDPYFTSIVSHLYFDGSMPKDGKGTYYNQKDNQIMDDFISKIHLVFGDVSYKLMKDHRGVLKCRIPRIIGEISRQIYEVDSFNGNKSRIAKFIFSLGLDHKLAFIFSGIIDEGSIAYDGTIIFGVMNKALCEDFRILSQNVGLKTGKLKNKKNSDFYYFHIKDIENFKRIHESFSRKYPHISLRHKKDRLEKAIEIKKQKFLYSKEFSDSRKKKVLKEIKNCGKTINALSLELLIPPRTIRRYMYLWISEDVVKRKKIKNEYFYFLS